MFILPRHRCNNIKKGIYIQVPPMPFKVLTHNSSIFPQAVKRPLTCSAGNLEVKMSHDANPN